MTLPELTAEMDSLNMAFHDQSKDLEASPNLQQCLKNVKSAPNRFGLFVNLDWEQIDSPDFIENNLRILRDAKTDGAMGLKSIKDLD